MTVLGWDVRVPDIFLPCSSLLLVVEQLAMSRALGDYQYKGNVGLGPEHQMVRA